MPPRKRARVSQATSPTPTSQPKTPTPAESSPGKAEEQLLNDPWTDEEEIGLFKGLMRWKPTGIHKHFHLMSLHRYLLDGGYIHPKNEHTKPAGIWRKLETLYNLDALDEREDARQLDKLKIPTESDEERSSSVDADADAYSDAANKIDNEEFELPDADFAQDKWERRLETGRQRRSSSPMLMAELNLEKDPPTRFTPSFSIEPSDAATPASRKGRPRASTGGARGKPTAAAAASGTRRATRQAESVAEEAEEQEEEQEEESDEEAAEESEEQESEQSTPAPRSTRSTKGARSRPPARRGRGRGR